MLISLCLGCASSKNAPLTLLSGVTDEGAPVCLDDRTGIPAAVEKFYAIKYFNRWSIPDHLKWKPGIADESDGTISMGKEIW